MDPIIVLDTKIIDRADCWICYRRWLKGKHPDKGVLHKGYSGWETIQDSWVLKPKHVITISPD